MAREISRNHALAARVRTLLPAGMSLRTAARGFKSEKQFLEALHASKNLNIPFRKLQSEMTGHDHDSLAEAIRELAPSVDARAAVRLASSQAKSDLTQRNTNANADHDRDGRL